MKYKKYIGVFILLSLTYCVMEILRKSSKFDSNFELYRFYLNVVVIIAVIVIFIAVQRIVHKQFNIPVQNKIKRFNFFDKLAFILIAVGFSDFIEDIVYIFTKGNNDGISKNQQNNNESLENNPLWYSLFDGSVNAPIIEEIMFRGIFYLLVLSIFEVWRKGRKRMLVYSIFLIISSVYFGFRHVSVEGDYQYIYPYIASGIVLSIVFIITKNILYSAAVHAISNFLTELSNAEYYGVSNISGNINSCIAITMLLYLAVYITVNAIKHKEKLKKPYQELNN